ncbi:MAG TPA: c-type cytochrome, partial [Candidatus Kapabacteria bacterium]|nr:c-type cytochrome [Candidatus Kapabacteria bacterium]
MFGWIKKRRDTPVEERSYSGMYAFWSGILFLTTLLAVWNEVATRRPWKEYQHDFYALQTHLLQQRLADARHDMDKAGIAQISKDLAAATAKLNGPDARKYMDQIDQFKRKVIDLTQQRGFEKSRADAENYLYEHNKRLGDAADAAKYRKDREDYEKRMDDYQSQADMYQKKVDSLGALLKPWQTQVKDLQAKHDSLMGTVLDLEKKIDLAQSSAIEIKQIIIPAFDRSVWGMNEDRIDRCQTCHMGWNDSLYMGPEFERSLMDQYSNAAKYVNDNYGSKTANAVLEILQNMVFMPHNGDVTQKDLETALGKNKDDAAKIWKKAEADKETLISYKKMYGTHPQLDLLKLHNPEKFGCSTCHGGESMALSSVDEAHGFEEHWDSPLLVGKYVESSCVKCHTQRYDFAPYAQTVSMGKKLYLDFGCYGCHDNVDVPDFKTMKQAPSLRRVAAKLTPDWMFNWIKNPRAMNSITRMPNFELKDDQIDAVVTYLTQSSEKDYQPETTNVPNGDPARGKDLVDRVGCIGCHSTKEFETTSRLKEANSFGPSLENIGSKVTKVWLFNWLKNPKHYMPNTRMPNLRLSDQEAADITAHILQDYTSNKPLEQHQFAGLDSKDIAQKGYDVIKEYGCYGCHDIKGFEDANKVSVPHNDFGNKIVQQLYWGTIPEDTLTKVREHFDDEGLELGHSVGAHHDEDWYTWTILKLKSPRIFQSDEIQQKMPDFTMSDSEAYAISVYLRSLQKQYIPAHFQDPPTTIQSALDSGRFYVRWRNCIGCHKIENVGGSV